MALIRPAMVFFENVPKTATKSGNQSPLDVLKQDWKDLHYMAQVAFVNTKLYGLPQNRDRCIVVGLLTQGNTAMDFSTRNVDTVLTTWPVSYTHLTLPTKRIV